MVKAGERFHFVGRIHLPVREVVTVLWVKGRNLAKPAMIAEKYYSQISFLCVSLRLSARSARNFICIFLPTFRKCTLKVEPP